MSVPPTIVTNCSSRLDRGAYRARLSEPSPAKVDGGDNKCKAGRSPCFVCWSYSHASFSSPLWRWLTDAPRAR